MVNRNQHEYNGIGRLLWNAGFRPNHQCYCGCGDSANNDRYFSPNGGHDRRLDAAFIQNQDPEVSALLIQAIRIHIAGGEDNPMPDA